MYFFNIYFSVRVVVCDTVKDTLLTSSRISKLSRSRWTASTWPFLAAKWSGVCPFWNKRHRTSPQCHVWVWYPLGPLLAPLLPYTQTEEGLHSWLGLAVHTSLASVVAMLYGSSISICSIRTEPCSAATAKGQFPCWERERESMWSGREKRREDHFKRHLWWMGERGGQGEYNIDWRLI